MPDLTSHIAKAQRNEQFYHNSNQPLSEFREWAVVVLFYIALHYVDAALSKEAGLPEYFQHPTGHRQRFKAMAKSHRLSSAMVVYHYLYNASLKARYTDVRFSKQFLSSFQDMWFGPFRRHLRGILQLPAD